MSARRYCHRLLEAGEDLRPAADQPGDPLAAGLDIGPDVVDHQPAQPVGMLRGIDHRDDAAHRGADQHEPVDPEPIDQRGEIAGLIGILVGAVRRPGALAMAAHIHRDEVGAVLDPPGQRVERLGARCVAVHADDRQCAGPRPIRDSAGEARSPPAYFVRRLQSRRHGRPPSSLALILPKPGPARTYNSYSPMTADPGHHGRRGGR